MRGRKPKPSYMRVLDGNASHSAKPNPEEPVPPGQLEELPPPSHLNDEQKQVWREAVRRAPPGLLRHLDTYVFEQWVVHAHQFRKAAAKVAELGPLLKAKSGTPYQNPYLAIMNRQSKDMRALAAELGFTPSSRSRVKVEKTKGAGGAADPFAGLRELNDAD